MKKNKKKEIFNGGTMSPFWDHDCYNKYHNKFCVELDSDIDSNMLISAWEKTKQIYPLIDCIIERVNGDIVFYKDKRDCIPIKSKNSINPRTNLVAHRVVAITYYENTISMSAYHSVLDGGGINSIFSTFLYYYLGNITNNWDDKPLVCTKIGRKPHEYYKSLSSLKSSDFVEQPLVTFSKRQGMFVDNNMIPDENGDIYTSSIKVSVEKFISFCKENGANPSAMLSFLMAKAAYKIHSDNKGDIAFVLTMNARKAFHVEESIANVSANLLIPIKYDDMQNEDIKVPIKNIRSIIDYQRSDDYLKTLNKFYETYDWILAKRYAIITYIGKIDIGSNTQHIKNFKMTDDATSSIFMMELNGEFVISCQLGKATQVYTDTLVEILNEYGVETIVSQKASKILPDTDEVVL